MSREVRPTPIKYCKACGNRLRPLGCGTTRGYVISVGYIERLESNRWPLPAGWKRFADKHAGVESWLQSHGWYFDGTKLRRDVAA